MSNKLFLVCPFSCMENYIRTNYGDDVFFITAMAAVFQSEEQEYIQDIAALIAGENITQIFVVNDTSCRFINNVLKKESGFDTPAEKILQKIYSDNHSSFPHGQPLPEQQKTLAMLNVKQQADEIMKQLVSQQRHFGKIKITGLVTMKASNSMTEININN
ncbi:MAG: carbonic anhydrase [Bacteroidota bacterium]